MISFLRCKQIHCGDEESAGVILRSAGGCRSSTSSATTAPPAPTIETAFELALKRAAMDAEELGGVRDAALGSRELFERDTKLNLGKRQLPRRDRLERAIKRTHPNPSGHDLLLPLLTRLRGPVTAVRHRTIRRPEGPHIKESAPSVLMSACRRRALVVALLRYFAAVQ
jgi:hypothetical protein